MRLRTFAACLAVLGIGSAASCGSDESPPGGGGDPQAGQAGEGTNGGSGGKGGSAGGGKGGSSGGGTGAQGGSASGSGGTQAGDGGSAGSDDPPGGAGQGGESSDVTPPQAFIVVPEANGHASGTTQPLVAAATDETALAGIAIFANDAPISVGPRVETLWRSDRGTGYGAAAAASQRSIASGNLAFEFSTHGPTGGVLGRVGLANEQSGLNQNAIDFAVQLASNGVFQIIENGAIVSATMTQTYAAGTVFRIEVSGTTVRYLRGGTLVYTSSAAPTYPLYAVVALNSPTATIHSATLAAGGSPEPVVWSVRPNAVVTPSVMGTWNTTGVADGMRTVRAVATDDAGNDGSASVMLTVDNTLPSCSFDMPANMAMVSGTVTLGASASDAALFAVSFYLDGGQLVDIRPPNSFSYGWNTTAATNGAHTLTVRAFDRAGNVCVRNIDVTVSN